MCNRVPILSSPARGVGFSFIFSWVLMAIVATMFVVGGNTEKLLCEPLANRQLFKVQSSHFHSSTSPFAACCGDFLLFSVSCPIMDSIVALCVCRS